MKTSFDKDRSVARANRVALGRIVAKPDIEPLLALSAGWYHWPKVLGNDIAQDCKCPCHRGGQVIHVMPCCGANGPGSGSMPRKRQRKPRKEKIITLFANQKPE
jgi:hypothetical protein